MAAPPKRILWDACTWISFIQKEKITKPDGIVEDRYSLCRSVIDLAASGKIELIISGLCLVEVCKEQSVAVSPKDQIGAFFDHDYILVVPLDTAVGNVARKLIMDHTAKAAGSIHVPKPQDASHIATAMFANVDEMHTFDGKLIRLSGKLAKLDGTPLKICKPAHGGSEVPLLAAAGIDA